MLESWKNEMDDWSGRMTFLGILALIQILFLPGILAMKVLKPGGGLLQKLIYIVGISLILNFLLVFLLTALHIYLQPIMLVVLAAEIGGILFLYRSTLKTPLRETFDSVWERVNESLRKFLDPVADSKKNSGLFTLFRKYALIVSAFIAVTALVHMGQIFLQNIPSVFNTYDAIVSWNQWGTEWAQNAFPVGTEDYPQLGPSMFSLTYVIIGSLKVQFFAKALMPLFLALMMLMFFDLGMEKPSFGILLGVEIVYLTVKHFVGEYISDGYMDIPLAFFAFLGIYALLKSRQALIEREKMVNILLGFFFAAGAAVTKQAGLYILVVYPFLSVLIHGWGNIRSWVKNYRSIFLYGLAAAVLVVLPWYALKTFQINTGSEVSHLLIPIARTSATYDTFNPLAKISSGLLSLGKYALGFIFIIPALFIMDPAIRWITLLIVLPFTLLWAGYASYDVRNVTLVWPFFALAIAVSLEAYLEWFFTLWDRLAGKHRLRWGGVLIIAMILTVTAGLLIPSDTLIQKQETLQKQILNPELNQQLYDYFAANPSEGKILTNYPVDFLPGFEGRQFYFLYNNTKDFEWAIAREGVNYLLVPSFTSQEVKDRISQGVENGEFLFVFSNENFIPEDFYIIQR
jgi:hypothetical protein